MQGNGYMRAGVADDPRTFVQFVTHTVINESESRNQGRPIFEPKAYLRQERAGERDILMREAGPQDKANYPEQWRAYQEGRAMAPAGTPIAVLFPQFPEIVATLEYHKIKTVEQLAEASDTALQNVGLGAREWQSKAREFLGTAKDASAFHVLKAQLEKSDTTIAKLQAQLEIMQVKLDEKPAPPASDPSAELTEMKAQIAMLMEKRGPGRPRKDETE